MKEYIKNVIRKCSLFDVKTWYEGESVELEKWTGFGFYDSFFVSRNNMVTVYYNKKELDRFAVMLDEKLTDKFFDDLCDNFFELISEVDDVESEDDIFRISVQCWPALTFFDVISKYPDMATEDMVRRLIRIRQTTESFHYELSKKIKYNKSSEDYIFFKGKIIRGKFDDFIKEQGICIVEQ